MKSKDIMYMLLAVGILLVAGYLGYTQLVPQNKKAAIPQVEVVGVVSENFDSAALAKVTDGSKVRDFGVSLDLTTGLNNPAPFGQ
ncbi:MAG: hypothetical protein JWN01_1010 [Patescibacteria group bacterium]|nr:hypothetical protein [Patescibacteria group bacterium]